MRNKGMIARKTSEGTPFRANGGHAAPPSTPNTATQVGRGREKIMDDGCERRFDEGVDEEEDASPDRRPHTLLHSIRRLTSRSSEKRARPSDPPTRSSDKGLSITNAILSCAPKMSPRS